MAIKVADLFSVVKLKFKAEDAAILKTATKLNTFRIQLQRVVGFIATGTAAGAIFSIARDVAEVGDQADKVSQKLGISATKLQEFQFAAKLAGTETRTFNLALQRLQRRANEAARGEGSAVAAFAQLGVQLRDSAGNVKPLETLFLQTADALKKVENQGERVRLGVKLLDSEGLSLITSLQKGSSSFLDLANEARALGGVLDTQVKKTAAEFVDNLSRLRFVLQGLKGELLRGFGFFFNKTAKVFFKFFKANRDFIKSGVFRFFRQFGESFARIGRIVAVTGKSVVALTKTFGVFGRTALVVFGGLVLASAILSVPFLTTIAAVLILLALFEDLKTFFEGGDSLLGRWELFRKTVDGIKVAFVGIAELLEKGRISEAMTRELNKISSMGAGVALFAEDLAKEGGVGRALKATVGVPENESFFLSPSQIRDFLFPPELIEGIRSGQLTREVRELFPGGAAPGTGASNVNVINNITVDSVEEANTLVESSENRNAARNLSQ